MRELPILFSGAMVRATIDGRKTQTRRIINPQPRVSEQGNLMGDWLAKSLAGLLLPKLQDITIHCPYGQPGDTLYVREAWRSTRELDAHSGGRMAEMCLEAGYQEPWAPIQYEADLSRRNWEHTSTPPHDGPPEPGRYRHARFMPRWASRLELRIADVRVERLSECSEADCRAEGCAGGHGSIPDYPYSATPHEHYRWLWESINGAGAWDVNPWVWVVEFKAVSTHRNSQQRSASLPIEPLPCSRN